MLNKDLYQILGIKKESSLDDIRKAFMKQALIYHPDKAPEGKTAAETEQLKVKYQKQYLALQNAYKILVNPKAREQYDQTQQNLFVDLKDKDKRDVSYKKTKAYTIHNEKGERVFDDKKFTEDFNKSRASKDTVAFENLQKTFNNDKKVTNDDYHNIITQRDKELQEIAIDRTLKGDGSNFNINSFNKMFDHMKQTKPASTAVQAYGDEPLGLFSGSRGLVEESNLGGMTMEYGLSLGQTSGIDSIVAGATFNPEKDIDLSQFKHTMDTEYVTGSGISSSADKNYNTIEKASVSELQKRIDEIQKERDRLNELADGNFIVTQSEIEKQYSELFETNERAMVEGIAQKKKKEHKKQKEQKD